MSYYDPPPDPPFFAPAEPEAPVQPPASEQNQSSNLSTSSSLRKCSVKNCGKELPESHNGKMCDECRGRHRVYASTKRQKRKMEKMAVGLTLKSGLVAGDGAVFMPPDPGHGRSVPHVTHPPPPELIASSSTGAVDGREEPDPVQTTPANWDAQIDPRLFQPSPAAAFTGASASPSSPNHVEDEETPDHDEQVTLPPSSSQPPRYCSIKGCRQVLPGDHAYKMCQSCRDRYREYGNVKREKWKKNKEAALALLEQARQAEEQRRKEAGLPSLAELPPSERKAWEENLMPRVPPPPPAGASALPPIRMCTVSHCHVILSGDYEYRRCEQHRVQNRHHSKLKRVRDKEEKATLQPPGQASSSSPGPSAAHDLNHAGDSDEDDVQVVGREDHVCQIKGCYNFLDPLTPWLMCSMHRQIDQGSLQHRPKQHAEINNSPSPNELHNSVPAPSSQPISTSGAMETILAAASVIRPPSGQHVSPAVPREGSHVPPRSTTPAAGPSTTTVEHVGPASANSDDQATSQNESRTPTAQPTGTTAPEDSSADPATSNDVHLHPKLRVPYFFHPAYVSYPGHPPMLMSIPSPFAPPAPGHPPSQFGPSQFVQAGSPFVQGGPYAYPYMMPIPPPAQPSPFTNASSAPSPFAPAPYPPGWYGPAPPPSEPQETVNQGPHVASASAQAAATSSSATSQHLSSASRPEASTFMSTLPPAPRPLTFKHAPGSSVFNTPTSSYTPTTSDPNASSASPTAPASVPLPSLSSSASPSASGGPSEKQQQRPSSSQPPTTSSPTLPSTPAFYNPSLAAAALASADNTLAAIRRGSDTVFAAPPSRPGVRRRSAPSVDMSGSLEIVMYDPTLPNRKRRRIEEGSASPEATPGPSSITPAPSSATFTPSSVDAFTGSSMGRELPIPSSPTPAPAASKVHPLGASSGTYACSEAIPPSSTSAMQTCTPPPFEPAVGIPLSALGSAVYNASRPSTSLMQVQPQAAAIANPQAVAAHAATPTICRNPRCRRKVRAGALCERCVGKTKHAKKVLRARHRLEPVRIGRKVSIR